MAAQDNPQDNLRVNLSQGLQLPSAAVDWLMMLWNAIQVFDDAADGDPINPQDLNAAIWDTLVAMPTNDFYVRNAHHLSPMVASMILKWWAANDVESVGRVDERSYMWRAGYYDVVLMVCNLCHGPAATGRVASQILGLYGEKYEDYKKEFLSGTDRSS